MHKQRACATFRSSQSSKLPVKKERELLPSTADFIDVPE
jgi:hypothetical protein